MEKSEYIDLSVDKSLNRDLVFNIYAGNKIKNLVCSSKNKEITNLLKEFWFAKFNYSNVLTGKIFNISNEKERVAYLNAVSEKFKRKFSYLVDKISKAMSEMPAADIDIVFGVAVLAELIDIHPDLGVDEHILD